MDEEKILSVSAELFLEKGYDKTSMQDIARTAGISKGAIYHHFNSKDEVIEAVTKKQEKVNHTIMETWLSEIEGLNGREKLIAILEKNIESQEARYLDNLMSSRMKSAELLHSDLGSQNASQQFESCLSGREMRHSFSCKGNPYDNACIESFRSVLKKEEIYLYTYQDAKEARRVIFEYIESWYNRKRIHSAIDYMTPQQKEDMELRKTA